MKNPLKQNYKVYVPLFSSVITKQLRLSLLLTLITGCVASLQSCKKQLEVDAPIYNVNEVNAYDTDASASAVLAGILQVTSKNTFWKISTLSGLSADELNIFTTNTSDTKDLYYKNALDPKYDFLWSELYGFVYYTNSAINGLNKSTKLTPTVKKQLLGEAKFLRAFTYYYLVNLYGEVPLILQTDYQTNSLAPKNSIGEVYSQIITDLLDAQNDLSIDYLDGSVLKPAAERVRPTKWAATALLSRVYMHTKAYDKAELEATKVINANIFQLVPLNEVFKKTSQEAIWQLQTVDYQQVTNDGFYFILPSTGPNGEHPIYLNTRLVSAFEAGDQRKANWTASVTIAGKPYFYAFKYKENAIYQPSSEYQTIFRLAEVYLIRAEAKIRLGKIQEGITDINEVRARATDASVALSDQLKQLSGNLGSDAALTAVLHEKQVELFTELGQRWFDLKRTGLVNPVMTVVTPEKGGIWNSNWQLYPIPNSEILANPNLRQNVGY
ncbi:RagB/SusD family nutrient uptake outer membrane protein [Pedobacter sp. PWIIR3]